MIKRTKNSRQRGSHTHGWGAMKKHRGAGNRGGRGNAGSGKRGDAKKPSFWKNTSYSGNKKGFVSLRKPLTTINIADLNKFSDTKINLKDLGYDKLLGQGNPTKKYQITVSFASSSAIERIKKAGGTVSELSKSKKVVAEEPIESKVVKETDSSEE